MRRMTLRTALMVMALFGQASAEEPIRPDVPSKAPSLSFNETIERAVARNPSSAIAAREIQRAEALAEQVRATWLPSLNATGTYTRLDADRSLNGRVILGQNQLSGNVTLNVPLFAPRQWAAYARSKENVDVARADESGARREVAVAAARAYLTVVAQRRVLASAERALTTAKAHEEYATTRFGGGIGNRLDAVRAAQERATADVRVRTQVTSLARAQEALGVVIGEERAVDVTDEPSLAVNASVDAALADVSTRRPDIAAQRDRVEVARKFVRDSWVDYLPMLSAVAQPFYQDPPTMTLPQTGWQAQLVLSIPLFDGGDRYGKRAERSSLEAEARTRLEGALRQARSEVRIAFESIRQADEALVGAREAAKLAREALDLSVLSYRAGATSNIEVVDAERRAEDAEIAAAVAEDASRQARLDLLAATGRFP